MQMIQSNIYSITVYGVYNRDSDCIELWSQVPAWSVDYGWVGLGFIGILADGDAFERYRDIVSDNEVHEFEAMICLKREMTACK